jgi:hypothetical protein
MRRRTKARSFIDNPSLPARIQRAIYRLKNTPYDAIRTRGLRRTLDDTQTLFSREGIIAAAVRQPSDADDVD